MSKTKIAVVLYHMKKAHTFFTEINGEQYGVDELLTMFYSREVSYNEAMKYMTA